MHRDPKAFARPFRRDVDVVIDVQACVFDAVAHQSETRTLASSRTSARIVSVPRARRTSARGPRTGSDVQILDATGAPSSVTHRSLHPIRPPDRRESTHGRSLPLLQWADFSVPSCISGPTSGMSRQPVAESSREGLNEVMREVGADVALTGEGWGAPGGDVLEMITSSSADGITIQDATGSLIYANDAAARVTGFASGKEMQRASAEEIVGRFENLDEEGRPLPVDELPGRRAFTGERNLGGGPVPEALGRGGPVALVGRHRSSISAVMSVMSSTSSSTSPSAGRGSKRRPSWSARPRSSAVH